MDVGEVLKRAWEITWKNKGFWLLGILASCSGGGGGGGGNNGGSAASGMRGYNYNSQDFPELQRFLNTIPPETLTAIALAAACLAVFLGLLALFLGALGQAGLIAGFYLADAGHPVTLSEAFRRGLQSFWKILAVQLIVGVLVFLAAAVLALGAGMFALGTLGIGLICLIPLTCLLVPLALLVGVYVMLVKVAIVAEDLPLLDGFQRGWTILRAHLGSIVLIGLILVLGGGLVGLLLALPFLLVTLPAILGLALGREGQVPSGLIISALCAAGLVPVAILVNGILQTFVTGAWTLTFRRLAALPVEPPPESLPPA